ncbi:BLUF domain-containing protein [Hymenobacter sp. HSC-4F20]|uniref:BLUF domain-containing protein n=1 Tax=Hymenobacter sp. HSC-4F20 TaxID=2864135 RepID=UPI001C729D85|nr:BLUF domain-containing protein [Hymenobacter sp. HSC-4F20]MBX0290324.1 BLUF domain-containing protein [Hymenobacter sp. HSC-4F20]
MSLLHHIIYQSNVVAPLSAAELGRLLEQCCFHNRLSSITGVLLYDGSRFLQVLEGPAAAVAAVFARIQVDCRHTAVEVLADGPMAHRQFANWSMGLVNDVWQPVEPSGPAMSCLHTVTDAALWLLIREFQVSAGQSVHPVAS